MSQTKERDKTSTPNLNDKVQICCSYRLFDPSKIKEKVGKVLPCCFSSHNDSIEPQEKLNEMLTPFREYCDLESREYCDLESRKYCDLESRERFVQLHKIKEQLVKVLAEDKARYESLFQDDPRQLRKRWRDKRIKIYDYLLRHALYNPNQSEDLWIKEQKFTSHFYCEAILKLKPERFYTYLVDQVHEDEEIMFKLYCVDNGKDKQVEWQMNATWLVGSIHVYRNFLIDIALEALRPWEDGNQPLCDDLVKKAKEEFVDKVSNLHWKSFKKERNWRNRARFYYLLGHARHTGISNGRAGKFKNFDYEGPFCRLVREMIVEDEDLFDQESEGHKNKDQDLLQICKAKYRKQNNGFIILGHLKVDTLLAWASAANDLGFVRVLLKYYLDSVKSRINFDYEWEISIGKSWAMALWNASYRGRVQIIKELLSWEIPYYLYYSKYFFDKMIETPGSSPLHIVVLRMDVSVVDAFCTITSPHFNCNEKDPTGRTPLEIATKLKVTDEGTKAVKKKIQNLLLQRQEVKVVVEEANNQRQLAVDSANAVMVGGTLIAGITFGAWLSPPLGYNSYYQFMEPSPLAPPNSYESYMSVEGHLTIQLFAIFNSLSFYFAVASIVAGMETFLAIKEVEDTYVIKTVKKLRRKLTWATNLFLASVVCVLVAFSCAGIAILPPIKKYQTNIYMTTAIGGFICVLFICKMVWYALPKDFRSKVKLELHLMFDKWKPKPFSHPMAEE